MSSFVQIGEEPRDNYLKDVARQDLHSFEKLYDKYASTIYTMALNILKVPSDAEEIVQDVFLHIWNNAKNFDSTRGSETSWILTIARSKAIDKYRAFSRKSEVVEEWNEEQKIHSKNASNQDLNSELKTYSEAIRHALNKLPNEQKTAIEQAFIKGMSHNEISKNLGIPLGTVKARIRRGMESLKKFLPELN